MWKQVRAKVARWEIERRMKRYQWTRVPQRDMYWDTMSQDHIDSMLDALEFDGVDFDEQVRRLR